MNDGRKKKNNHERILKSLRNNGVAEYRELDDILFVIYKGFIHNGVSSIWQGYENRFGLIAIYFWLHNAVIADAVDVVRGRRAPDLFSHLTDSTLMLNFLVPCTDVIIIIALEILVGVFTLQFFVVVVVVVVVVVIVVVVMVVADFELPAILDIQPVCNRLRFIDDSEQVETRQKPREH